MIDDNKYNINNILIWIYILLHNDNI